MAVAISPRMANTIAVVTSETQLARNNLGLSMSRIPSKLSCSRRYQLGARLLLIQIVFFQEFGPEILWRSGNVGPTLWRKVHEIPIRPHRVDMIPRKFSSPEMRNLSI